MEIKNDILLRVLRGEEVERPPVWLMRQAGRILPQYRAIRAGVKDFPTLVSQPELAAEVTIQPVDELGVDAAIIFSDILVIPEAMGLPYEMVEKKGPYFPKTIQRHVDLDNLLEGEEAAQKLGYVYEALQLTKHDLSGRVPLIGFSGAPWTLFAYMIEGSGSKTFAKAKKMLYTNPDLSHQLLQKITHTVIAYLQQKIKHGADVIQLFDSWAGILSPAQYQTFSLPYLRQICEAIPSVPLIVFAKGAWFALEDLAQLRCAALGLDWNMEPQKVRNLLGPAKVFQGNLDPCCLYASKEEIKKTTRAMLNQYGGKHIANLGHGVYPDTPLDNVKCFVDTVQSFRYSHTKDS